MYKQTNAYTEKKTFRKPQFTFGGRWAGVGALVQRIGEASRLDIVKHVEIDTVDSVHIQRNYQNSAYAGVLCEILRRQWRWSWWRMPKQTYCIRSSLSWSFRVQDRKINKPHTKYYFLSLFKSTHFTLVVVFTCFRFPPILASFVHMNVDTFTHLPWVLFTHLCVQTVNQRRKKSKKL